MAQKDNLRKHGPIEPLSHWDQMKGRTRAQGWNLDQGHWEQYQAKRMAYDLNAFCDVRYPLARRVVMASCFLTLGAICARKAGVDSAEMLEFVIEEREKIEKSIEQCRKASFF